MKLILQIVALILLQLSDMAEVIELSKALFENETLNILQDKLLITSW